jgi:hypothetical protein
MKTVYVPKRFSRDHENTIRRANHILDDYARQGFVLTLRQLYYQFVAKGFLRNADKSYVLLGRIVGAARLAGRIDWSYLEDRTRNLRSLAMFGGPGDAVRRVAEWYREDLWRNQKYRPEVWIEKDALLGMVQGVCEENGVPYFSCRGYTSLSEMYEASVRFKGYSADGKIPYVIHLGDHDPSGIDMSRDIVDRIADTFRTGHQFVRVALNMDQIEELNPPPNPAKVTDSRFAAYLKKFGNESWELDALDPPTFRSLILDQVESLRDKARWDKDVAASEKSKRDLEAVSEDWDSVARNQRDVIRLSTERAALAAEVEKLRKKIKGKKPPPTP